MNASRASEWYAAQMRVQRSYPVSSGVAANVVLIPESGPHLELILDNAHLLPTAAEALAFARWLLDTFGEGNA